MIIVETPPLVRRFYENYYARAQYLPIKRWEIVYIVVLLCLVGFFHLVWCSTVVFLTDRFRARPKKKKNYFGLMTPTGLRKN